jgi:hypothetical protein
VVWLPNTFLGEKMKTKTFYTCGINWQHDPAIRLFDSVERLKEQKECWAECGIVEVEVVEKAWVEEQDLDGCVEEENPSFFTDPALMGYDPDDPEQQKMDEELAALHLRGSCVAYQEGGIGCPSCYDFICDACGERREGKPEEVVNTETLAGVVMCESCNTPSCGPSCANDACSTCGGNTPARIDEQIEWMEKKIAARRAIEEHKDALQKLADNPIYDENEK